MNNIYFSILTTCSPSESIVDSTSAGFRGGGSGEVGSPKSNHSFSTSGLVLVLVLFFGLLLELTDFGKFKVHKLRLRLFKVLLLPLQDGALPLLKGAVDKRL